MCTYMNRGRATLSRQRAIGAGTALGEHRGYSMVELMVILIIIGILLVIGIPALLGGQVRSQDRAVQSDIRNVYSVEKIIYSDNSTYTDDPLAARAEEPSFTYVAADTPVTVGEVYLYLAPGDIIYVMAKSASGTCYYLRDADGAGADFATSAPCGRGNLQTFGPGW